MIVAVDFDDTCSVLGFPDTGKEMEGCIETLKYLQSTGHQVVIWTCREDRHLVKAQLWFEERGFFPDAYNDNAPQFKENMDRLYPGNQFVYGRKIGADMFIDDKNFGGFPGWKVIRQYFEQLNRGEHEDNPHRWKS